MSQDSWWSFHSFSVRENEQKGLDREVTLKGDERKLLNNNNHAKKRGDSYAVSHDWLYRRHGIISRSPYECSSLLTSTSLGWRWLSFWKKCKGCRQLRGHLSLFFPFVSYKKETHVHEVNVFLPFASCSLWCFLLTNCLILLQPFRKDSKLAISFSRGKKLSLISRGHQFSSTLFSFQCLWSSSRELCSSCCRHSYYIYSFSSCLEQSFDGCEETTDRFPRASPVI